MRSIYLLQVSNLFSGLGNSLIMITIPWLVLDLYDSPSSAGIVLAASSIPALLISPVGGWLIDKVGPRPMTIGADVLSAISVFAFPITAYFFGLSIQTLLLLAFFGALFDPVGYTARRTLITGVANAAKFNTDRLNGIHEGVLSVSWILGPAIGAWLIAFIGPINSFLVAGGFFLIAAVSILILKLEGLAQAQLLKSELVQKHIEEGIWVGFVTLWNDKVLRTITIAVLIIAAVYLPTESVLLPTYFEKLDQPASLGLVISSLAAGSAIGAFCYGWLSKNLSRRTLLRLILMGAAVSIIPMSFLPPIYIFVVAAFVLGLSWGPFNPLINTLIQTRVPQDQHGRVFGVQTSLFYAAPPLGMIGTGFAIESFGLSSTYLFLVILLSTTALLALLTKSLRSNF